MFKLNKVQKKILRKLNEIYPALLGKQDLIQKTGLSETELLQDVEILSTHGYIKTIKGLGSEFPFFLQIEPEGIEKLRENFISIFEETIYKNPLATITIILTVIFGIAAVWYYVHTTNLQNQNLDLQKEKSILEKPILITPDVRTQGNSVADLRFIVKNPSHSLDYYYLDGYCIPDIPDLFSNSPSENTKQIERTFNQNNTIQQIVLPSIQNKGLLIPSGGEITLYCSKNYVNNPVKDAVTKIKVCVNIQNIEIPICNQMGITILKV